MKISPKNKINKKIKKSWNNNSQQTKATLPTPKNEQKKKCRKTSGKIEAIIRIKSSKAYGTGWGGKRLVF